MPNLEHRANKGDLGNIDTFINSGYDAVTNNPKLSALYSVGLFFTQCVHGVVLLLFIIIIGLRLVEHPLSVKLPDLWQREKR